MDLVRQSLLEMERRPLGTKQDEPMQCEGHSEDEIQYHLKLLREAELIEAIDTGNMDGISYIPVSLTWNGHEFLDAARDDTRWNKMKTMVKEKAGVVGFEVIKKVLVVLARQAMGL
jgi:hypothetical protein